jgi:2',3'-cyclic-nucleotide 2'-phosphodiesterase (5'-nucleotidase family)
VRTPSLLLFALWLLVLPGASRIIEGIPLSDPAATGESGLRARIVFSSNQLGEFEPCECKDLPLGGLAETAGLVQDVRDETAGPVFFFDAGDRFFRFDMAAISQAEAARRLKAILMVDAANVSGLDAAGIGGLELGAGLPYLVKLAQRARYPMVSANLISHDGAALFPTTTKVERGALTLGVTSVLPGGLWADDYETGDPMKAARAAVKALRAEGVDLVVILSNLGLETDRKLARAAKPDLILGSRSREILAAGERVGPTTISHAGSRGRYLGEVRMYSAGKGAGAHLVATTVPVIAGGRAHPGVAELVQRTLDRLADPTLGVEPIYPWDPRHPGYRPPMEEVQ